jgi:hypothetical protein
VRELGVQSIYKGGGRPLPRAFMVRSPGFEPGSSAWQADVLAKLDYDRSKDGIRILRCLLKKRYVSTCNTRIDPCRKR